MCEKANTEKHFCSSVFAFSIPFAFTMPSRFLYYCLMHRIRSIYGLLACFILNHSKGFYG